MLAADKAALEQQLAVSMLDLQWKELDYLHSNFKMLATSSALLLGFGFAALGLQTSFHPERAYSNATGLVVSTADDSIWELGTEHMTSWFFLSSVILQALFTSVAAYGLSNHLLSLFIATTSIMCGPGLALRGPEGSVSVSVRHLEAQLKRAMRFFGRGLVATTTMIVFMGLRRLHNIGFAGGGVSVCVGLWTLTKLWHCTLLGT